MVQLVDRIIKPKWLIPVVPRQTVYTNYAVVINDGKILDILPEAEIAYRYSAAETLTLSEHALMPGLINAHTHAAMALFRGLADDLTLESWLQNHIWPAEQQHVSPEFVYEGTLLACAEMLSGGITTFNDMYFYPDAAIRASLKMGMRMHVGLVVLEFPTSYAKDADNYLSQGTEIRDHYKGQKTLSFGFAPHAPYTVSNKTFEKVLTLSDQLDIGIHTHLHETAFEITQSMQQYGARPLARLASLGILGDKTSLAHCVHVNAQDQALLSRFGAHIVHCPSSNLKLASGIAPIHDCMRQGINVSLGTDGAASNNRLDMWSEMRLAALLAKGYSGDATAVSAFETIEMATINGARALGLQDHIGSLEIGKQADMMAIHFESLEMSPCFDPVSHLVYVSERNAVTHVWVSGEARYLKTVQDQPGVFAGEERNDLMELARRWQSKIKRQ